MPSFTAPPGWAFDKRGLARSFYDANGHEWQALIPANMPSIWLVLQTWEPVENSITFAFHTVEEAINAAEALARGRWEGGEG